MNRLILGGSLMLLALMGCGGTGQDDGTVSPAAQIRGVAVDGYLSGAFCFLDINEDYRRNAFEPSTLTDADGYYSYNPNTDTNYCADTATSDEKNYCLSSLAAVSEAPLRCRGGYDVLTEEPFQGTLSARVDVNLAGTVENVVISPLTTLLATAVNDAEKNQLLDALNVSSESELSVDYIANRSASLVQTALRLQKIAQVLAEPIRATHDGDDDALVEPVSQIYEAMTDHILANNTTDIQTVLSDAAVLSDIAQAAESLFVASLTAVEDEDSAGTTAIVETDNRNRSGTRATQILEVANQLCVDTDNNGAFSDAELNRCGRSVEVLVKKAVEELNETTLPAVDESIERAVTCLTSSDCDPLLQVLGEENFDLTALQADDFTSGSGAATAATIADDATPFTNLAGMSLRVNDPDNTVPTENKHARLELYFGEGATSTSGTLTACVRYIDGSGASEPNRATDEDLENGDTRGSYVTGTWQLLGQSGYSVVLNLSITPTSTPYTAIMKSAGSNSDGQLVYRFDFDDDLENWLSVNGIQSAPTSVPTTSDECRERFNTVSDS